MATPVRPCAFRARLISAPMPLVPPVTSATRAMVFSPLRLSLSGDSYHVLPARPRPAPSHQGTEVSHIVAHRRGGGRAQALGMAGPAVAATGEPDDAHAGGHRGLHARHT